MAFDESVTAGGAQLGKATTVLGQGLALFLVKGWIISALLILIPLIILGEPHFLIVIPLYYVIISIAANPPIAAVLISYYRNKASAIFSRRDYNSALILCAVIDLVTLAIYKILPIISFLLYLVIFAVFGLRVMRLNLQYRTKWYRPTRRALVFYAVIGAAFAMVAVFAIVAYQANIGSCTSDTQVFLNNSVYGTVGCTFNNYNPTTNILNLTVVQDSGVNWPTASFAFVGYEQFMDGNAIAGDWPSYNYSIATGGLDSGVSARLSFNSNLPQNYSGAGELFVKYTKTGSSAVYYGDFATIEVTRK